MGVHTMGGGPEKELTPEQKKAVAAQLGTLLHDEWRAPRLQEDGTYEPRERKTKDQAWIDAHGTDTIDIANTAYPDLPEDWKGENKAAAEAALEEVFKANDGLVDLDDKFIEEAAAGQHQKWIERNSWVNDPKGGNPILALSFDDMKTLANGEFPWDEYDRNRKLEFEDRILDSSNPDMVKICEAANMQRGMTWGSPDAASDAMHDFYEKIRAYASENLEKDRAIVRKAVELFQAA